MATASNSRVQQIGDGAIAVLAAHGARGLTHRAVDQAAGLPRGTTSNYARTRAALLKLSVTRIAELDTAIGAQELAAGTPSGLAAGLAVMLHHVIADGSARARTVARLELALEATRRPELRAVYNEIGADFRAMTERLLAAGGSTDPERDAQMLVTWAEGVIFYAIAGAGSATIPAVPDLRRQADRLLATLGISGSVEEEPDLPG